jgi:hypothetical protein
MFNIALSPLVATGCSLTPRPRPIQGHAAKPAAGRHYPVSGGGTLQPAGARTPIAALLLLALFEIVLLREVASTIESRRKFTERSSGLLPGEGIHKKRGMVFITAVRYAVRSLHAP